MRLHQAVISRAELAETDMREVAVVEFVADHLQMFVQIKTFRPKEWT